MAESVITQSEELALIEATLNGNGGAFEELIRPYLPEATRVLTRRLASKGPDVIDTALQEALLTAWRALERFDANYRFKNYFFGIVREVVRRTLADRPREIPTDWEQEDSATSGEPIPAPGIHLPEKIRQLIGEERFPPPDEKRLRQGVVGEVLEAMLAYGGYPHQQVAFIHSILLWGKAKNERRAKARRRGSEEPRRAKAAVWGDPDRVVRELSDRRLADPMTSFRQEVTSRQAAGPNRLDRAFEPVEYRLALLGRDLFAKDKRSAKLFLEFAEVRVSESLLRQYFGKDARKSVADWTEKVKSRTREALVDGIDPRRSPLPWPEGHENGDRAG